MKARISTIFGISRGNPVDPIAMEICGGIYEKRYLTRKSRSARRRRIGRVIVIVLRVLRDFVVKIILPPRQRDRVARAILPLPKKRFGV
jgi:hypothetical protein